MWACPKCQESLDDDFDICWQCGTDREGNVDESFVSADDAEAIMDPAEDEDLKPLPDLDDEFGETLPELVACFEAGGVTEARFVADQLRLIGIPATSDKININTSVLGGYIPQAWGYGPKVRVRAQDLTRAMTWIESYKAKIKERREHPQNDDEDDD